MLASHLVEVNELSAPMLCDYIETKHYNPIQNSLRTLHPYAQGLPALEANNSQQELILLLFTRLKQELEQMMRTDQSIVFKHVKAQCNTQGNSTLQLPVALIQKTHKRIMQLLERIRQSANNYLAKPDWSQHTRMFYEELFSLEQMVQQAIYLKENVLMRKAQTT
ncbi:MAG TPA: hypothetical protein PKD90_01765 [Phnomibacter sp.]|nr:hypothetical protein [Phnomibacter sp.]